MFAAFVRLFRPEELRRVAHEIIDPHGDIAKVAITDHIADIFRVVDLPTHDWRGGFIVDAKGVLFRLRKRDLFEFGM